MTQNNEKAEQKNASWYLDFKVHAIVVALLALVFYWNTFQHEYALDDTVVIVGNEFVHEGFAGIPDILGKDAYYSYYNQLNSSNQLVGGRYRPLSIVTFAVEQQFFGATTKGVKDSILTFGMDARNEAHYQQKFLHEMHTRHVLNVVWYILAVVVLLYFLRYVVFRGDPIPALLAAILFAVHPLHTEVVANVKSRDEIMSVLFIALTFIFAFKYREQTEKKWLLGLGLLSYFLAFLSKEYAITLLVLLPLSFCLFRKETMVKSLIGTLPYLVVAVVYLVVRWQIIGPRSELSDTDIQINPYAFASHTEKIATEIATSLNYLKLLIFPHPLSADYSYNQIPYKDFGNPLVWLSLLVHGGLVFGIVYFFKRNAIICFAIAFFLLNLLMVNNFLFDIGATMGERLIFHSSVGFAVAVGWLLYQLASKIKPAQTGNGILLACMLAIIILCGYKTIDRNKDWKNDHTLFTKDINVSPNSFLVNVNVGTVLINNSDDEPDTAKRRNDVRYAIKLFTRVLGMQDNYVLGYLNRSIGYLKLGEIDSMVRDLDKVKILYPIDPRLPNLYYHAGDEYYRQNQFEKALTEFKVAASLSPGDTVLQNAVNVTSSKLLKVNTETGDNNDTREK